MLSDTNAERHSFIYLCPFNAFSPLLTGRFVYANIFNNHIIKTRSLIGEYTMPAHFTQEQQNAIRENLFHVGLDLSRTIGVKKMTISNLTKGCGIAKGSFYSFYESKEVFLMALIKYTETKKNELLTTKLNGRDKMSVHEFFEFYREYFESGFDFMAALTVDDFLWLRDHLPKGFMFEPTIDKETAASMLSLTYDIRSDYDPGIVVNLIKSIYAMKEHRNTFCQESLHESIEMILQLLESYLTGKQ